MPITLLHLLFCYLFILLSIRILKTSFVSNERPRHLCTSAVWTSLSWNSSLDFVSLKNKPPCLFSGIKIKKHFPLISPFTYFFNSKFNLFWGSLSFLANEKNDVISKYFKYWFNYFRYVIYIDREQPFTNFTGSRLIRW